VCAVAEWLVDQPLQVGCHTLRGRIYQPAHQPGLADGGHPGPRYVAYHRARAGTVIQVAGQHLGSPTPPNGDVPVFDDIEELDGALAAERLDVVPGVHVTLATSPLHVSEDEGINTLYPMIRRLAEVGVDVIERVRPTLRINGQVRRDCVFGEAEHTFAAASVVHWSGGTPRTDLIEQLRSVGLRPIVLGGALRPRRALHATKEAKQYVEGLTRYAAADARPNWLARVPVQE